MNEHDAIRQALLAAAEEDLAQTHSEAPPAFSPAYRAWERRFLHAPPRAARQHLLRWVACFLLAVALGTAAALPVWAAVSGRLAPSPAPTPTGLSVSIQLRGTHGSVYTSERFTCVAENGRVLRYWYQNAGQTRCTLQLYRVGLFRDEAIDAPLTIAPGEEGVGLHEAPGNGTYYLRVTCVDGGSAEVSGSLRADQYD